MTKRMGPMLRTTALALTFLTGFSGLIYEVTWQRYLATLLGSHSEATAAILGLFLGGLSVGYSLFGTVTRRILERARATGRPARLLLLYGAVEAGIGAWALAFPLLFTAARSISLYLPLGSGGVSFAFDVGLCALLVGPPAVLMGATIPILTQALARSLEDATRFHALIYGINTAGAFAGALAAGYWLIPALGLVGVLVAMGCLNLFAGGTFVALGLRAGNPEPEPNADPALSDSSGNGGFAAFIAIAGLTGFAMMAVQTVLIRLGGFAFGASQFTFAMVVAVFVLCIALGSLVVSALPRISPVLLVINLWGLGIMLMLLYPVLENSPYWVHVLRSVFRDEPSGFYVYHLAAFVAVLLAIGPAVILSGATLPLIFHHLRREHGGLGGVAGRLYSGNTLGSLLGALLGGYTLLFWLDLHHIYQLALVAVAVGAALATRRVLRAPRSVVAGLLAAALALVAMLPPWSPERLSSGLFRFRQPMAATALGPDAFFASVAGSPIVFYDDDPVVSVAVRSSHSENRMGDTSIIVNGKRDGSLRGDYVTMALASLLPALLANKAERGFVIGYGTGVSLGELAALESMREVIVAEISPGVVRAAPLFDYGNLGASVHRNVSIITSDAYRALLRSEGLYDVIVSEPSNPWVTGVEMLFSREFLEAARDRLTPGGVYAQWFHAYDTDDPTLALVLRTYKSVFDHVAVWYAVGTDLLLLGITDAETALDIDRLVRRVARPDFAAGLRRCGIEGLAELLPHELLPLDVLGATEMPGPIHTLLHPRLSYSAARAFFVGGKARFPVTASAAAARTGERNSLIRRYTAHAGGRLPDPERAALVIETCRHRARECVTLLAEWTHDVPDSPARDAVVAKIRSERLAPTARLHMVTAVSQLYGTTFVASDDKHFERAQLATQAFLHYYHHGAPFYRGALATIWDRCDTEDSTRGEACAAGRAEAEEVLGRLDPTPQETL